MKRVSSLEDNVGRIKAKHDADEAREQALREEEERKKRERDEEERRQRDKKEREDFQAQINKEVSVKLDQVYEAINGKKDTQSEEVSKLKARIEELQRRPLAASTSGEVIKPAEDDEVARLHSEQVELKKATDRRLAAMEEVIHALQRQCEDAEANAEVWKAEALRPGNKRGGVAIGDTPMTQNRVRPRLTLLETPGVVRRVDERLKGIVERHQREVDLLKEMRLTRG
ncbi:hypothetical protein CBR_g46912 [Chara braunii]|uniref:Uncharacterized protein n=1 Tax=Chara braunii TaxID=69332 RepID=A0A388M188_CHABU|nr:hypothetical protein CBR_g46912 [Chara braunii]|eukprot:GBG88347.1 hypothetical protein CBR_g46912 [Chara braunii]